MNLSLRRRIQASFIVANLVVWVLTFTVFFFLDSLNKGIEAESIKTGEATVAINGIGIAVEFLLKSQRDLMIKKDRMPEVVESIIARCDSLIEQLNEIMPIFSENTESAKLLATMASSLRMLKNVLGKATYARRFNDGSIRVNELVDVVLKSFIEFQEVQYRSGGKKDERLALMIKDIKRYMMLTLIICFLFTVVLGLIVPSKIALPFKKIKDAIRELQACNLDVSIFYNQDDEIGEIAKEMNKMIRSIKIFDELRTDRILVENRKFDALANLVKKPVLVANAEGKLIYMNNIMYSLLQVESKDVLNREFDEAIIPPSIVSSYRLAIKRRSKIENTEVSIYSKEVADDKQEVETDEKSSQIVKDELKDDGRIAVFEGYANIIPIRGKESSLDYYLMVLSQEIFT